MVDPCLMHGMPQLVILLCLVSIAAQLVPETCAGWPLPGKTTSFAGGNRWQHVGNHRIEVIVTEMPVDGDIVRALMPWARHDDGVESKGIVVMSAETGQNYTLIQC